MVERLARCIGGLAMFGVGIAMFIVASLGLAPWDVLHQGLGRKLDLSVGVVIEIIGFLLLVLWIPFRLRPGIGTLLNAIEIGVVVDLAVKVLPDSDRLLPRLAYVLAAIVIVGIGSGLYIGAELGAGPRDGLMIGISQHGVSIRTARTMVEVVVMVIGIFLGGSIGVGTLAFMLGIGPAVHFFIPRLRMSSPQANVPEGPEGVVQPSEDGTLIE